MGKKLAWVLSLAVLVVSAVMGAYNGITEWGGGRTLMQHSVNVGVLLYGILGLITAFGLFQRRAWLEKEAANMCSNSTRVNNFF
jgi:hypothetical protein